MGTRGEWSEVQEFSVDDDGAGGNAMGLKRAVASKELTAEMFPPASNTNSEDYRENMDCNAFMRWLEKHLWPMFTEMFSTDKIYICPFSQ